MTHTTPTPQRGGWTLWAKASKDEGFISLKGLFDDEPSAQEYLDENFADIKALFDFDYIVTIAPYESVVAPSVGIDIEDPDPNDPEGLAGRVF